MASVTFPVNLGGDGSTVSDDSNPSTGLANGGHRTRFVPALFNTVAMAQTAVNNAQAAAASASSALNAPGTNATSTTSLTIGLGSRSFTLAQTGKAFSVGQAVVIANSASTSNWMVGLVTAFNSGTGAMTVNVTLTAGSGTAATWTISVTSPTPTVFPETRVALGAGTNIDVVTGNYFTRTISAPVTFTVSNTPAAGAAATFILDLTNGGSATIAWWSGVRWASGVAPTLTASGRDVLGFFTHDGGTTWTGLLLGRDVR